MEDNFVGIQDYVGAEDPRVSIEGMKLIYKQRNKLKIGELFKVTGRRIHVKVSSMRNFINIICERDLLTGDGRLKAKKYMTMMTKHPVQLPVPDFSNTSPEKSVVKVEFVGSPLRRVDPEKALYLVIKISGDQVHFGFLFKDQEIVDHAR